MNKLKFIIKKYNSLNRNSFIFSFDRIVLFPEDFEPTSKMYVDGELQKAGYITVCRRLKIEVDIHE